MCAWLHLSGERETRTMKKYLTFTVVVFLLVMSLTGTGQAEVKNVQMQIAGYLCGN
jgi:hypothetical protein